MNTTFSCDFVRTCGLGHVEQISGGRGGRELWPTGWWNLLDILEGFQVLPGVPGESLSETGERDMGQGCEIRPGGSLVSILSKPSTVTFAFFNLWIPCDALLYNLEDEQHNNIQQAGFGISQSSPCWICAPRIVRFFPGSWRVMTHYAEVWFRLALFLVGSQWDLFCRTQDIIVAKRWYLN